MNIQTKSAVTPIPDLDSDFYRLDRDAVAGYAFDRADPARRLVVELLVDGLVIGATRADQASARARTRGLGDGYCGFSFTIPEGLLAQGAMVEARLANLDMPVGCALDLDGAVDGGEEPPGEVQWSGGLRFVGWIKGEAGEAPEIRVLIDGALVAEGRADRWRRVDHPRPAARNAFDIVLPKGFADGRVWSAAFHGRDGAELAGSPVVFCAPPLTLEDTLARLDAPPGQRLTARFFDALRPGALPFAGYADARASFQPTGAADAALPIAVVVLDGDKVEESLASVERQTHAELACGVLPPADAGLTFLPRDLAEFVESHAEGCDWFLILAPGAVLNDDALARFAAAAASHPEASLVYADYETADGDGRPWPIALPAFSYERMLEQGYFAPIFMLARKTVERAVAAGVSNLFRLANLPFDADDDGRKAFARAVHLPGPAMRLHRPLDPAASRLLGEATLDHVRARGMESDVVPAGDILACKVRRKPGARLALTILIATRNRHAALKTAIDSILPAARTKTQILVVDNESSDPQTLRYLRQAAQDGVEIVKIPGPFNPARLRNEGAAAARGELLLFLDDTLVAEGDQVLAEMLSRLADATAGAVGGTILSSTGVVDRAGVTLGVGFSCGAAFGDRLDGDPGYHNALRVARETAAVAADCLLTPRALFQEAGGFDASRFPLSFHDVDYCLRLGARGLRTVVTPHARFIRQDGVRSPAREIFARESARELWTLRHKWGKALAHDPFYNPMLALSDPPYGALALPPRDMSPRLAILAPGLQPPPGF